MSFDKVKAMRTAEKFLAQGKTRSAIVEYKRIVENDPKDYSTLNMLGDLHVKNTESDEAVICYTRVAEHFSKQGFAQKAIAIYNKISRLQPDSADVSAKLAKLYQMKGSVAEARSHYVQLAEQYQRRGQKAEALEIWKQIAELDPLNTDVYLKIAETCWQEGNKEEASKAFTEAGLRLARQNQFESALTSFSRALEIRPYDLNALNGYVNSQVKLGFADDAAKHLESILEKNPYNREILYLLVDCYIDSENPREAEKAVVRLVEQEPANYPKFLDLVELYIKTEDLDSAVRILSMSSEHLLVGGKSEDFHKWTDEILAHDPEQIDALRLLVRYHGWQRDESELRLSLERLAEIARVRESLEDEHYALSQLVMIMPHEISHAQRLQEIKAIYGVHLGEIAAASAFEVGEAVSDVPTFEGFAALSNETNDGRENDQNDYSEFVGEVAVSDQDDFVYTDSNSMSEDEPVFGADFAFVSDANEKPETNLKPADEMRLDQELESIRFYISQGYIDLAEKTLEGLELEFGKLRQLTEARALIGPVNTLGNGVQELVDADVAPEYLEFSAETLENSVAFETETVEEVPQEVFAPEPESTATGFQAELPEGSHSFDFLDDFRTELGLEESEPADGSDYDTHYQMATAYKEMGLMEESIREFQDAINMVRVDDGTRRFFKCCNLLGLCFMEQGMPNLALLWYRRALETPDLNDEEKQALLYETAIAYEMGGERPKAVEYLEQIYAVNVDYRDVSSRLEQLRVHNFAM